MCILPLQVKSLSLKRKKMYYRGLLLTLVFSITALPANTEGRLFLGGALPSDLCELGEREKPTHTIDGLVTIFEPGEEGLGVMPYVSGTESRVVVKKSSTQTALCRYRWRHKSGISLGSTPFAGVVLTRGKPYIQGQPDEVFEYSKRELREPKPRFFYGGTLSAAYTWSPFKGKEVELGVDCCPQIGMVHLSILSSSTLFESANKKISLLIGARHSSTYRDYTQQNISVGALYTQNNWQGACICTLVNANLLSMGQKLLMPLVGGFLQYKQGNISVYGEYNVPLFKYIDRVGRFSLKYFSAAIGYHF